MDTDTLHVQCFRSFAELAPMAAALDALNRESRAVALASSFAFTRCFAEHDDVTLGRDFELLWLAARQGERLIGYLPLRRRRECRAGLTYGRVETLVAHHEAGRLVARPQDEARCAAAFLRHLRHVERGWSVLAFRRQDADSPLLRLPVGSRSLLSRRAAGATAAVIPLGFGHLAEYARSLSPAWRSSVGRNVRRLFAAGEVALLRCTEATHPGALLDLYVDLERCSHKARAVPPLDLGQHGQRVAFYRALIDPAHGFAPAFSFVLLDGRIVSGLFSLTFAGVSVWKELAYDEQAQRLGPGTLSVLAGIDHAIEQRCRAIDFGYGLEQYKSRWGAILTPTWDLELCKLGGVPYFRALARSVRARFGAGRGSEAPGRDRKAALACSDEARGGDFTRAVKLSGARVERLTGTALRGRLPFSTQ